MRTQRRRRHNVPGLWIAVLRPLLRYSHNRDAYVLRVAGGRFGPVLTDRTGDPRDPERPLGPQTNAR